MIARTMKKYLAMNQTYRYQTCSLTLDREVNVGINVARWARTSSVVNATSPATHSVAGRGGGKTRKAEAC